jgi:hypothetical protein
MNRSTIVAFGLAAACGALALPASGQDVAPDVKDVVTAALGLSDATLFDPEVDARPGEPFVTVVPIAGELRPVALVPHSVRAQGYKLFHQVEGGALVEVEPGPVRTLAGLVQDAEDSLVAGSLLDDGLHLKIMMGSEIYWVQPAPQLPGVAPGTHVVYHNDHVLPTGGTCGTLDQREFDNAAPPQGGIAGTCGLYVTQLACEADFYYFQDWGAQTESRIETVINAVNTQYTNEVDITHEITAIIIRTSLAEDPYSCGASGCSASTLLNEFRLYWLQNHGNIVRDVAHLFTGREISGGTIGIAFDIGAICTTNAYCLAQSDCCGAFACATDLTAHELGHLWGATHCTCPTFTMNPSLTCVNQFNSGSESQIIAHRDSRTCLHCSVPNDNCTQAVILTSGTAVNFNTQFATTDGFDEPAMCTFNGYSQVGSDVWWRYTGECDGMATLSLCFSAYNTKIAVYQFGITCPTGANQAIACNDDSCTNKSVVTFPLADNNFYRVRVGGFNGAQGTGQLLLTVECDPDCPSDTNGDGATDVQDLTAVILAWGTNDAAADVNDDGVVNVQDLTEVILAWGDCA